MVPICAGLLKLEAIRKGLARRNASKTDAGHPIHLIGQNDAVPVNRGGLTQAIGHPDGDRVALAQAPQGGAGIDPLMVVAMRGLPVKFHGRLGDHEIDFGSAQHRCSGGDGAWGSVRRRVQQPGQTGRTPPAARTLKQNRRRFQRDRCSYGEKRAGMMTPVG